jgi:hypothetical protein
MNTHIKIMGIKKLIVSGCNSLNLLGVGELTPFRLSRLMPVSQPMLRLAILATCCFNKINILEVVKKP